MEKVIASSLSSENEAQKTKKRSKLAIIAFILSLIPILLIIFYGFIRDLLFNSPLVYMLWYNLIIEVIPFVSLILSIIAIIIIKRRKLKGMGLAITGLIISIIEGFIFLAVISRISS